MKLNSIPAEQSTTIRLMPFPGILSSTMWTMIEQGRCTEGLKVKDF